MMSLMCCFMLCIMAVVSFINTFVTGDRILLLTDTPNIRNTHSIFLKLIKGRGHSVTIRSVDNPSLSLLRYGERLYDHLIIFAPTTEKYAYGLSAKALSSFINEGGNVLAAGAMKIGSALRELAIQSGFEFDEDGTAIIDHFNYDTVLDNGEHTTIVAYPSQLIAAPVIVGDAGIQGPVLFRGVAIDADESNRLCLRLLTASTTAYSFRPDHRIDEYPMVVGRSQLLVGALQTRSNARVLFAGSLDMFSDVFISSTVNKTGSTSGPTRSGNLQLITELTKWVMMEKGVLRLNSVKHHRVGENHFPRQYTIMNHVEYAMDVEELKNGKWTPFNATDVQLEVVRMDPFLRTSLVNTEGKLRARFNLPDVYGVFKFVVDYHRTGYTNLHHVSQVSVRPLMHTQYERFILSAYPYYFSSFSMMIGVLLFSCVFLYHQPNTKGVHKNR